jgi:hypothetical protein
LNIFILDQDPKLAAQYQCNKHVVKMILESAQLLSTTHRLLSDNPPDFLYKATHKNHPCTIAVRTNLTNYKWLTEHALELCKEYSFRYKKKHKSQPIIEWCQNNIPNIPLFLNRLTLPQCMPEEYKKENDIVEAYRQYYRECKMKTIQCIWTNRQRPYWIGE